jgi:uncharacterized protein YlxW (UPF0749 family)
MSLLNEVMYRPVEPGYAEAARRPPVERTPAGRRSRGATHLLLAVTLGVITITAILTLRTPAPSAVAARAVLEEQVATRSEEVAEQQGHLEALSAEVSRLQAEALAETDPGLSVRLAQAELLSGAVAVAGPGMVVELDDAPRDELAEVDPESRVQDIDLQIVVNGLWASGAEAIAINGHRLTSLSAIRGANQAILVDLAPLLAPYRVEAIGDATQMEIAFARTSAAGHLTTLAGTYDIAVSNRKTEDLLLPGAGSTTLYYASTPDDVASSPGPVEEGGP